MLCLVYVVRDSTDRSGWNSFRCVADADRPAPTACPWQLCGRYDAVETGTAIDLTTESSAAWSHWGWRACSTSAASLPGKAESRSARSAIVAPIAFPGTPVVNYRWTTLCPHVHPTPTGVSGRGILVSQGSGPNIGFTITVQTVEGATPTGATKHTIKVYAGVFSGTARTTASSAGGASVYTETLTAGSDAITKNVFTIEYRPTDSWPLQLDWRLVGVADSKSASCIQGEKNPKKEKTPPKQQRACSRWGACLLIRARGGGLLVPAAFGAAGVLDGDYWGSVTMTTAGRRPVTQQLSGLNSVSARANAHGLSCKPCVNCRWASLAARCSLYPHPHPTPGALQIDRVGLCRYPSAHAGSRWIQGCPPLPHPHTPLLPESHRPSRAGSGCDSRRSPLIPSFRHSVIPSFPHAPHSLTRGQFHSRSR